MPTLALILALASALAAFPLMHYLDDREATKRMRLTRARNRDLARLNKIRGNTMR